MYKYFSVSASVPPKHLVFSGSFEHPLDLFFSFTNYLQVGVLPTINLMRLRSVLHSCASFPIAFEINKQNSSICLLLGFRPKQNCKVSKIYFQCPPVLFQLSDFLLGNRHNGGDTSHCSVFCLHNTPYRSSYNYYPHFILVLGNKQGIAQGHTS